MREPLFVMGIGAIEQHSYHLPIGTDWYIADYLAKEAAKRLKAVQIPTIPFSMSECHGPMAGTVWIKPKTLAAVLCDTAVRVKNLLLINGHCGNFIIYPMAESFSVNHPDCKLRIADENWPMNDSNGAIFDDPSADLHAGEVETAIMMVIHPELVRDCSVDFVPDVGREFLDYTTMDRISPDGVWGKPSLGTYEKGVRAIECQLNRIVGFAVREFGGIDDSDQ